MCKHITLCTDYLAEVLKQRSGGLVLVWWDGWGSEPRARMKCWKPAVCSHLETSKAEAAARIPPSSPTARHLLPPQWPTLPWIPQAFTACNVPPASTEDFFPPRLLISAPHHYLRLLISKGQAAVGHHRHGRTSSLGHSVSIPHWFDHKNCFRMLSHALKCLNFSICSPSLSFYLSSSFRANIWLWYLQSHWISRGNSEPGWGRDPWEPESHRKVQLQERAACFFSVFVIPKFKSQRLNRASKPTFSILLPNQNSKAS